MLCLPTLLVFLYYSAVSERNVQQFGYLLRRNVITEFTIMYFARYAGVVE